MNKIFNLFLITLSVLLIPVMGIGQTWEQVQMSPSVLSMDMCFLDDGLHGWVVGSSGAGGLTISCILHTTDGGAHWQSGSCPDSNSVSLNGICFVLPDIGWVVGNNGLIFATTDGGSTWFQQMSGTNRKLSRVHFIDSQRGWITGGWNDGSSYLVLKTTDGGNTWQNLSFGSDCYSCEDIWFADSLNGWICGQNSSINPFIYRTTDGGNSWENQNPNLSPGAGPVSSICFPNSKIGWASTSSLYRTPAGAILHTTNGGDSWYIQGYTNLHYNYCLDAQDTLRVAIASVQILSPQQMKVFVTTNKGENWNSYSPPIVSYTYGIQYVENNIWIGSDYTRILCSTNNGTTWNWQFHSPLWRSIAWSDSLNGWVVSGSHIGTDGYCYRTTDRGQTWAYDPGSPGGSQVYFLDANTGWMLFEGNNAKLWRTTNAGANWNLFSLGSGSWIDGIFFISRDSGWANGGNGTIRFTSDGGQTWTGQSSGTSNYLQFVYFVNPIEGWAGGGYGSGSGTILHTINSGQNWLPQTPAQPDHFLCASFIDRLHGWLGTVSGRVHRTTNGGEYWQVIGSVSHDFIEDILMQDEQNGWLVARNQSGGGPGEDGKGFIYKTSDAGASWDLEWAGPLPKSSISELTVQPGERLWACGAHNTILRGPFMTNVSEENLPPQAIPNLVIYPNPFSSTVRINY
ncbi:MAG: YCF48-related protein, partial [candidate division WOR-3 bacterium]|nr:YCF48-related protein [candidate division WOR-3 bacterium]